MSRTIFKTWGLGLNPDQFSSALAALGILSGNPPVMPEDPTHLIGHMTDILLKSRRNLVPWRLPGNQAELEKLTKTVGDAGILASAWPEVVKNNWPPRLQVKLNRLVTDHLPWILQQLQREAARLDSVSYWRGRKLQYVSWQWPLRIGALDETTFKQFNDPDLFRWRETELARVKNLTASDELCDIWIMPGDLHQSVQDLLNLRRPPRAAAVFVLGGLAGEPWFLTLQAMELLRTATGAAGMLVVDIPPAYQATWMRSLVEELSHDTPLDRSVHQAGWWDGTNYHQVRPYYLCAASALISESRLYNQTDRLNRRLLGFSKGLTLQVPEKAVSELFLDSGEQKASYLGELLGARTKSLGFRGESHEASGLAQLADTLREAEQDHARTSARPRWIQAQVFDCSGPEEQRLEKAIQAGIPHAVDVRIGSENSQWLMPPRDQVFPNWKLPKDQRGHTLQVVFSEPNHAPQPQTQTIFLPPGGNSTTCRFYFQPGESPAVFEGRIIVLYQNRILQTALLRAGVVNNLAQPGDIEPIQLTIETVLRPNLAGLEERRPFDAAVLVNQSSDGQPRLTQVASGEARLVSLADQKASLDNLRSWLENIARSPADYPRDLNAPANLALLIYLARQGRLLHRALVQDRLAGSGLDKAERIQVVAVTPESFLPLELIYDHPSPAPNAQLCPGAIQALQDGNCQKCTISDEEPNPHVCPFGFWGLRKVIERSIRPAKDGKDLRENEYLLSSEPFAGRSHLHPLAGAVYAASSRVDKEKKGQIQLVLEALDKATGQHACKVDTWKDWKEQVQTQNPSLLVLMPHTLQDDFQIPTLEISENQQLASDYLNADYVKAANAATSPLVLLLGCETAAPEIVYQGFISALRLNGAAIVLGTATSVLGRHVAPLTVEILELLQKYNQEGQKTFGDLMVRLRRDALADGLTMVFTLFAFGDADWQLD